MRGLIGRRGRRSRPPIALVVVAALLAALTMAVGPQPVGAASTVTVSGTVRDDSGDGLAGWTVAYGDLWVVGTGGGIRSTVTSNGSFSLEIPAGTTGVLAVQSPDLAILRTGDRQFAADTALDIVVPMVDVAVTVTDTTGAPVPDARVTSHTYGNLTPTTDPAELYPGSGPTGRTQASVAADTGTDGVTHLRLLGHDTLTTGFTVTPPLGSDLGTATVTNVSVATDRTLAIELRSAVPPARVSGTARDDSGEALAGWTVAYGNLLAVGSGGGIRSTVTSNGSFSLEIPAGATGILAVLSPDLAVVRTDDRQFSADTTLDIVVPMVDVAVTVTDTAGTPVPDARVTSFAYGNLTPTTDPAELYPGSGPTGRTQFSVAADTGIDGVAHLRLLGHDTLTTEFSVTPPFGSELAAASVTDVSVSTDQSLTVALSGPTPPEIRPGGGAAVEGGGGAAEVVVPVTLSRASQVPVTVQWRTYDGGGQPRSGVDYVSASGTVTFAPGETAKTVRVTVIGDTLDEPDEWIAVSFTDAVNATIGGFYGFGFGVIVDDDPPVTVIPGLGAVVEGDSGTRGLTIPVSLSTPSGHRVTVAWSTHDSPHFATVGADYLSRSGTVTFEPGETRKTVSVPVLGDTRHEALEGVVLQFANPTNGKLGGLFGLGLGFIVDDD